MGGGGGVGVSENQSSYINHCVVHCCGNNSGIVLHLVYCSPRAAAKTAPE